MARTVTPLTDPKCEAAKPRDKDYKLFDGQGLFLLVKASGVKTWRFKYRRPDGREGGYHRQLSGHWITCRAGIVVPRPWSNWRWAEIR